MRVAGKGVIGWDMGAALALGQALGLNSMVVAELLPELEAVMVRRINEKIAASECWHLGPASYQKRSDLSRWSRSDAPTAMPFKELDVGTGTNWTCL